MKRYALAHVIGDGQTIATLASILRSRLVMLSCCAKACRRLVLLFALGLIACEESEPGAAAPDVDASSDAETAETNGHTDSGLCPASGEPAIDGCPCLLPQGDYCCSPGEGMTCSSERVWSFFYDGPCYVAGPSFDDAGAPPPEDAAIEFIDIVECRR